MAPADVSGEGLMSEKQFPPSPKRLGKLKKNGKVVKTQWVSLAAGCWAAILCLTGSLSWVRVGSLIQWLNSEVWAPEAAFKAALLMGFRVVALVLAAVAASAIALELAQSRGLLVPSLLLQGFQRYRPGSYVSRVKQGFVDGGLGLLRLAFLVLAVVPAFASFVAHAGPLVLVAREQRIALLSTFLSGVAVRVAVVFSLVAVIAYVITRWNFFRQHRMSLQEVREEHKEGEGDPHFKATRKHEHAALVFAELERRVRRSKVVVVRRASKTK